MKVSRKVKEHAVGLDSSEECLVVEEKDWGRNSNSVRILMNMCFGIHTISHKGCTNN